MRTRTRTRFLGAGPAAVTALGAATVAYAAGGHDDAPRAVQHTELVGRSILPAETYRPGSAPSGHFLGPSSPIVPPFPGQPVQGFSGVHRKADGSYLVMSDNGFGNKPSSPDFELRVHRIVPDFPAAGGTGTTRLASGGFGLSDPRGEIPWTIWRDGGCADKELLVNLMAVPDPRNVGGLGAFFTFPFVTIEDVEIVDRSTIAVLNDNNFPAAGGRSATVPDENELILLRLDQPLDVARELLR